MLCETRRPSLRVAFVAILTVFLAWAPHFADSGEATVPMAGDFDLEDINPRSQTHGETLSLSDLYAERGVVLQFTASWCRFCRAELPLFEELHAAGRAPVVFMAADDGGSADGILGLAERSGITAPILFVPESRVAEFARMYRYRVLPATFLIDSNGAIRDLHQGATTAEALSRSISESLGL